MTKKKNVVSEDKQRNYFLQSEGKPYRLEFYRETRELIFREIALLDLPCKIWVSVAITLYYFYNSPRSPSKFLRAVFHHGIFTSNTMKQQHQDI